MSVSRQTSDPDGDTPTGLDYIQSNQKICPACPQKIIFCIDLANEMDETLQGTTGVGIKGTLGSDVSRILLTRRLLLRFIHLKLMFNNSHEFAIVVLNEKAVWHMDFSNDEMLLEMAISELYPTGHYNTFGSAQHVGMARDDVMVQVILVYGRSAVIPDPVDQKV
ncbi:hypothetical protein BC936DRAFT_147184 [Jimgerdemannia flammicorona]|uniref:BRISC and BRCA1-A complex member 1 n=1 Tax=Jimgerdemannia flammicorona TaxID=994334 RepID=A0A433D5Z0_9FUNG|nr:hypothetical protein BC936DRAFT_147184 [Jimgerdemannia flammicorona]